MTLIIIMKSTLDGLCRKGFVSKTRKAFHFSKKVQKDLTEDCSKLLLNNIMVARLKCKQNKVQTFA